MKVGDIIQITLSSVSLYKSVNETLTLAVIEEKWHAKEQPSHKLAHMLFQMENY